MKLHRSLCYSVVCERGGQARQIAEQAMESPTQGIPSVLPGPASPPKLRGSRDQDSRAC
jgi:hypothetical protein